MSAHKRKERTSDFENFDSIQDLILRIKTKLNHRADSQSAHHPTLVTELYELATLSERLLILRSNSSHPLLDQCQADILDREGTYLWNHSSSMRLLVGDQMPPLVAALRLAGFRLIEAGSPENLDVDCLVHMLQLASKTGATLAGNMFPFPRNTSHGPISPRVTLTISFFRTVLFPDLGKYELASSVLTSAAKFEQSLRNADDPQNNMHQQSIAQATVVYYCSRMEAAWKEGNDSVAQYMLRNITESNVERLTHLSARDRELLASKVLEIGRSLLSGGGRDKETKIDARAEEAVRWLQKAFSLVEHLDDTLTAGAIELKRCILRNLARAYVLSSSLNAENLTRAETALNELLDSIPPDDKDAANQELRWWKLAVLKRRNAPEDALFETFRSIIDYMEFTEDNVTKCISIWPRIFWYPARSEDAAASSVCLGAVNHSGLPFVDRLLLAIIFHCSKDVDHARAMHDLGETFSLLESTEFELHKIGATACLMYGERKHSLKRYSDSVDWFLLGTRKAFLSVADACASKCFRKAALCHIEQEEYAQALAIIRQCPGDEAATHYLTFLVAVKQGWENDAIQAVKAMVHGTCFDHRMLLMATRVAHESDLKNVLLSVLQALLDSIRDRQAAEMNVEPITLVRCMIRLVLRLIADPSNAMGKDALIDALTGHFATVQGCTEWDNAEERVPPLFDVSRELLETYLETALEADEEMHLCIVFSSFAATSARVFAMRKLELQLVNSDTLEFTAHEIQNCEGRLRKIMEKGVISSNNIHRVLQCLNILLMFEAELACRTKEWQLILKVIQKVAQCETPLSDTFEAIADMLWSAQDALWMAILHASLDRNALSVGKFARWLRAICTMLLSRNTAPDRLKAIGYVEQAIAVLEEHGGDGDGEETYPMDERYWLLTSSYNTGIECLHVSLLDDARRWFEASSRICSYVPDGTIRAKKITETYTQLMNRYAVFVSGASLLATPFHP
ncbi:hypothetical protein B0F90DRAFT_1812932 [Multifurca ochricompacta]|uniref:Protein ZIP4 homolog n=1 Tax=Multifurca ochricompacta TaxID=376703 RepID=A0AAD4MD55_9AGAM|nr:hypothetical protein B0F90DRAFT_1812932 [Multifurca ochricompacta]